MAFESVPLTRDCEAAAIPSGEKVIVPEGSSVEIRQSLGGSYTVLTEQGMMVRISGDNADALGKEVKVALSEEEAAKKSIDELIWDELRTVYDPEIPVNIVELGLVYKCEISDFEDGEKKVEIQMTLTAPGCGMGETLRADIIQKLEKVPGIKKAEVELVWEPTWDQSKMSDAAKLQLGFM